MNRSNKILLILCILNVAAFSFHGYQLSQVDRKARNLDATMQSLLAAQSETPGDAIARKSGAETIPDFEAFRLVIREEMVGFYERANLIQASSANQHRGEVSRQSTSSTASSQHAMSLQQDLNHYLSMGRMDKNEMASFQLKLAALPQADQKEMLLELTKAINEGDIDAHF